MGLHQTSRFLNSKGNHQQNEKTTYGMGQISANPRSNKGLIPKIYKELTTQYQKTKQFNLKNRQRSCIELFPRSHTDGQ